MRVTASTLAGKSATVEVSSAATIGDLRGALRSALEVRSSRPLRFTLGASALPRDDAVTLLAAGVTDGAELTAVFGGLVVRCRAAPKPAPALVHNVAEVMRQVLVDDDFEVEVCIGITVSEFREAVVDARPNLSYITDLSFLFPPDIPGRQLRDADFHHEVAARIFQRDHVTIDPARSDAARILNLGVRQRPSGDLEDYDEQTERAAVTRSFSSSSASAVAEEIAAAIQARADAREEK